MRTIKLLTMITAALALLMLPVAAQARDRGQHGRHGARSHAPRSVGVVRSFRNGVLTIRLAGGRTRTGDVTDSTKLTCQANRSKRGRPRAKAQRRQKKRGRRARAAELPNPLDDPGAGDDIFDPGDDPGPTDTGDDNSDDPGNGADDGTDFGDPDTGDDSADDTGDGADDPNPARPHGPGKARACSTAKLRRGMRVKAAKLGSGPDGPVWTKIALLRR
jgi:hypothetical protein